MKYPRYLNLSTKELDERIERAFSLLDGCRLCPRECGVNRLRGELGYCNSGKAAIVSSYNPHFGEEPPISGHNGSGTIFFTNCNMRCIYCQNYPISQLHNGNEVMCDELAQMMMSLQARGCHNVNFVTPTHMVAQILEALSDAVEKGLTIPLVYNSGGYDSVQTLRLLDGIFDIYMPDSRYGKNAEASRYSDAPDYVEVNRAALREMHKQVGDLVLKDGVGVTGLLIRHLVLPNGLSNSFEVFTFIAEELSRNTYVSLMDQYFPCYQADSCPELSRRINSKEYQDALDAMWELGLHRGWVQDHFT
ncbi:MAG: radical SAM protein [bacterium]